MRMLIYIRNLVADMPGIRLGGVIAKNLNAELTLLHVLPKKKKSKVKKEDSEKLLQMASEKLAGISVRTRIRRGNVAKRILDEIEENHHDMLVIASSRIGDYPRNLLINREILPKSPCCVVIAKNLDTEIKRILMLTGGLRISESMIKVGAKFAHAFDGQVTLMHVVANVPSMYTGLETIEETLEELLKTNTPVSNHLRRCAQVLNEHNVPSKIMLKHGEPVYEIIREIDERDYDLVIIGASGATTGFREWFLGNVTKDIIDLVGIPVMVVNQSHAGKINEIST